MSEGESLKVLLCEDHPMMVDAVTRGLATGGVEAVAVCRDGHGAVDLYLRHRPDVVLCDVAMPGKHGLDVLRSLRVADPTARVVMLSADDDVATIEAAIDAGAAGYLNKRIDMPELIECVRDAAAGKPVFDRLTAARVYAVLRRTKHQPDRRSLLTDREIDVLKQMASGEGSSNADVGRALYLAPNTVKTYVQRIFAKLEVNDRSSAVAKAIREGIID